jgi:hypothetical protein
MSSSTMDDVTELAVLGAVVVAGYFVYRFVSGVPAALTAAGNQATTGAQNAISDITSNPLEAFWDAISGTPPQSFYNAAAAAQASGSLNGLGAVVEMPHGRRAAVPQSSITTDGQFAKGGKTYQLYKRRNGDLVAQPL